jgi:hypothetical protein
MSILKTITILIMIFSVVLALVLAQDAKNILENKRPDIIIKASSQITVTGLRDIRPISDLTKYTTDGTFQTSFETHNPSTLTIKEITLTDPFEEEDCLILTNNSGKKLSKLNPLDMKARCQQITTGDPYRLNINITYAQAGSDEIKQELGTIKGITEDLSE